MLVWLVASVGMTVTVKLWWGLMFCSAHLFVGYPGCPVDYMGVWTETARNNIHLVLQRTSKAIEICARFIFWGKKAHHGAVEGFIYYMKWKRCCHCGEKKKRLNRVRGWAFLARKAAASKVAQTFWALNWLHSGWRLELSVHLMGTIIVCTLFHRNQHPLVSVGLTVPIVTLEYFPWLFGLLSTYRKLTV